jgi:hypothetical protein
MDEYYKSLYKKAAHLQFQKHDYTVQSANDPQAMALRREMHDLTNDIATSKSPITVEERLKTIEHQLRRNEMTDPVTAIPGQNPIMRYEQSSFLRKTLDDMRMNIKNHPQY